MGFEFTRSDRTVRAALRRIADEQAAAALKAAGGDGPLEPRVHAMRKSVKKMRGLIRLVRPAFDAFADENAALRDAARHLAPLREQDVLARTLAHLCADDPGLAGLDALPIPAAAAQPPADAGAALAAFTADMAAIRTRAAEWSLSAGGFDALDGGLARTWRQARRGLARATAAPSGSVLHDWRKRVKDHWYQARLLRPLWPEVMAPHIAAADRLGEALGDHHDLEVLCAALALRGDDAAAARLTAAARARQQALEAEAFALGARLLADEPAALAARWRVWWDLWRTP